MLYDYKFSSSQMAEIKNWKKENAFEHKLLSLEDLELQIFEVECEINYKITVPLNMFEKYAIRLIQQSEETTSSITMNISQIGKLLHLDKRLVEENLENLESIGMLNGVQSDIITINNDENAEYMQYENKFKKDSQQETYHLAKSEYENFDKHLQNIFEKDSQNRDKKFDSVEILEQKESIKNVYLLNYCDNKFLIYSSDGINSNNDLKFLDEKTLCNSHDSQNLPPNVFCHYDEFLPLMKDKLQNNKDELIIIGSKRIDKDSLSIVPTNNIADIYILSDSSVKNKRIFHVSIDDCLWIGNELYQKDGEFIVKKDDNDFKIKIQKKLCDYFLMQIKDIFPEYDDNQIVKIDKKIKEVELSLNNIKTKKETDTEIQKLNEAKNKLYGIDSNDGKKRSKLRKKVDNLENEDNQQELKRYPEYLKNKDKILAYQEQVDNLKNQLKHGSNLVKEMNLLKNKRKALLPSNVVERISPYERELKNLKRLKI